MKYSDYVKFAPVNLTYEEWINLEEIKKELKYTDEEDLGIKKNEK